MTVLLIRAEGNHDDAGALAALGIDSLEDPYVRIAPVEDPFQAHLLVDRLRDHAGEGTWFLATSPMTMPALITLVGEPVLREAIGSAVERGVRAGATGERTASTMRELGFRDVLVPPVASAAGLVEELADQVGGTAYFPCGNLALPALPDGIRRLGWGLVQVVVYVTETVPVEPSSVQRLRDGDIEAIVLRSPSAARALAHYLMPAVPVICAGETTATAARELGLDVVAVAHSPSAAHVAACVASTIGQR